MEFEQAPNYDPAHKTSSITSTSTTSSSIWETLPSLYSGRAESVASGFELDDLQEFDAQEENKHILIHEQSTANMDLLNTFLIQNEQEMLSKNNNLIKKDVLSVDQKRANHILSEQKRRNLIRGGFKELTELIPTLKNINNSKSTILFKSVDYIKQLEKRNKSLKDKLLLLEQKVKQKQHKSKLKSFSQKNKQLELLQEQLKLQQELLTKHNIQFDSISIPCMDDTPLHSPTLTHQSIVYNHQQHQQNHSANSNNALVIPSDIISYVPSFTIPADETYHYQQHATNNLLSSGKLNHLM